MWFYLNPAACARQVLLRLTSETGGLRLGDIEGPSDR